MAIIKMAVIPNWCIDFTNTNINEELRWWLRRWRIFLQCGRPEFDTWVGKIPWRRGRLPTPVLWPGEFHGLYSPWDLKELDTTEWLTYIHTHTHTHTQPMKSPGAFYREIEKLILKFIIQGTLNSKNNFEK